MRTMMSDLIFRAVDYRYDTVPVVRAIARHHGWDEIDHQENICMLSFVRDGVRLNFYYSKMTVGTAMLHPKKGRTQLFRRNVSLSEAVRIFCNPRTHTRKGYYQN